MEAIIFKLGHKSRINNFEFLQAIGLYVVESGRDCPDSFALKKPHQKGEAKAEGGLWFYFFTAFISFSRSE